jgi:DNA-binding NtrC family response regulator
VPLLIEHFLRRFISQRGQEPRPISNAVRQAFLRYPWPGNVRELENACERIAQTCTCEQVKIGCVPASVTFHHPPEEVPLPPELGPQTSSVSLDDRLQEVEANLIGWALKASHGNKSRAAELLKIKRSTLGDRIKKLRLTHLEVEG